MAGEVLSECEHCVFYDEEGNPPIVQKCKILSGNQRSGKPTLVTASEFFGVTGLWFDIPGSTIVTVVSFTEQYPTTMKKLFRIACYKKEYYFLQVESG